MADRLSFGIFLDDIGFLDGVWRVQLIQNSPAVRNSGQCAFGPEHACQRSRACQAQQPTKE
jgi:hypothetical protein